MGLMTRFWESKLIKEPVTVSAVPKIDEDYITLAKRAGFHGVTNLVNMQSARAASNKFRTFLSENGITVYPDISVHRYMNSITDRNHSWEWRSMSIYSKPIPDAVLMTMAKIKEEFSLAAEFEVTDIKNIPAGDPFLRVSVDHGRNWFIIERWDEPKYRMT